MKGELSLWLQQFHWLRPAWLWALLPLAVLLVLLWRQQRSGGDWRAIIAPELLPHLLQDSGGSTTSALRWWLLASGWLLATLALAGPSWERLPQPVVQREHALVAIVDLSLSMYAEDVPPSRMIRSRHKLLSLLDLQGEGLVGLVAYAGDAHVVAPLTDDRRTIANLVPALSPDIMPRPGSDAAAAVELGSDLIRRHGLQSGQLLLLTDGVDSRSAAAIADQLPAGISLSILGIGTTAGAPIPLSTGYMKDLDGELVVARLQRQPLRELAAATDGEYRDIRLDDADLRELVQDPAILTAERRELVDERQYDAWLDRAPWLALAILPIAAAGCRRGWLLAIAGVALLPFDSASALQWDDLWHRPDQRAAALLQRDRPAAAAALFEDPAWRGTAHYRAGDFAAAAEAFGQLDTPAAHYNRGNALARSGRLEEALAAYDAALAAEPGLTDAAHNRELVRRLLEQTRQEPGEQSGTGSKSNSPPSGQQSEVPPKKQADESSQEHGKEPPQPPSQDPGDAAQNADGSDSAGAAPEPQPRPSDSSAEDSAQAEPPLGAASESTREADPATDELDGVAGEAEADQAATERWLRQIPDDPAGLLRRKFEYESRRRAGGEHRSTEDAPRW